ncbi:MAG: nitroreductase family protein [Alicyclobacillaceae bacterium]|nr:nitroreductase family protein [Alicyclobacillaceae bacterium]
MPNTRTTVDLWTALRERRSHYSLTKQSPIADEDLQKMLEEIVLHTPSAFNSQTTRIVLLLGKQHDELWEITTDVLKVVVPADQFEPTQAKMNGFKNAYGTVLFFEDESIVEDLQKKFALYQDRFPVWAQHTSAMHQLMVWMALESEGLGASLQHYNPLIDERVKTEWKLPAHWQLIAQMPFGVPSGQPQEKQFQPIEQRVKVFKG